MNLMSWKSGHLLKVLFLAPTRIYLKYYALWAPDLRWRVPPEWSAPGAPVMSWLCGTFRYGIWKLNICAHSLEPPCTIVGWRPTSWNLCWHRWWLSSLWRIDNKVTRRSILGSDWYDSLSDRLLSDPWKMKIDCSRQIVTEGTDWQTDIVTPWLGMGWQVREAMPCRDLLLFSFSMNDERKN